MNINQAKAVAGIPRGQSVSGREKLLEVIEHCKQGIIAARRSGADARAAELSEAQQVFKRCLRARNACEVCGVPITKGATRCRLCRGRRALAGPDGQKQARQKPSRRIDVSPEGGWIARYGFWAGPVQKAVKRWTGKVSAGKIEHYFITLAAMMIHRQHPFNLGYVGPNDWACFFDLGKALDEVLSDKTKPDSWLIRIPLHVATDGAQAEWTELGERFRERGSPRFKPNTLTQAARRLRLLTPKRIQSSYRRSVTL